MTTSETATFGMLTIFDEIAPARKVPAHFTTGMDAAFVVFDGVTRGVAVFCRCDRFEVLLGLKIEPTNDDLTVRLRVTLDAVSHQWWLRKYDEADEIDSRRPRHVVVRCQGEIVGGFSVGGEEQAVTVEFTIPGTRVNPGGLLMLHLIDADTSTFSEPVSENSMLGLQLDSIDIIPATNPMTSTAFVANPNQEQAFAQGSIHGPWESRPILRFAVRETPRIPSEIRRSRLFYALARVSRKITVLRRSAHRRQLSTHHAATWPVTAVQADGTPIRAQAQLTPDGTIELKFIDSKAHGPVFFELTTDPTALVQAGFGTEVSLRPLA